MRAVFIPMAEKSMNDREAPAGPAPGRKTFGRILPPDVTAALAEVEDRLKSWSVSENPLIREISGYLFEKKGKRIRPALVILTERLLGRRADDEVLHASLVEVIHTASLVHDDIVDGARLRHGGRTAHELWGTNVTVLLGDHLYIKAISLALASGRDRVLRILAETSVTMIEGELDECAVTGRLDTDEQAYFSIIEKKTAALFRAACLIGADLAEAGPDETKAAAEFGTQAGLAFQICDDILDFTGDPDRLGKPVFTDFREGRLTLPLIHALSAADDGMKAILARGFGRKAEPGESDRRRVMDVLAEMGSLDHAHRRAVECANQARLALAAFPSSQARRLLESLADFIIERNL